MAKIDKAQGSIKIVKMEESITSLIKKNAQLEDKFDKVPKFSVQLMHSEMTTLHLL